MNKNNYRILRTYITESGKVPFDAWMNGLKDPVVRHRIRRRLDKLETGHYGVYEPVGEGVYELKFNFGSGYRIYFAELEELIVILLCAGDKGTQSKDIKTAKKYWKELLERHNE